MIAAHLRIVPNMLSWLTANLFGSEQRTNVGNRKTLQRFLTDSNQRGQARRRHVATSRAILSIKYGDRFDRATSIGQRMARRQCVAPPRDAPVDWRRPWDGGVLTAALQAHVAASRLPGSLRASTSRAHPR
jgi:hypothetical protein